MSSRVRLDLDVRLAYKKPEEHRNPACTPGNDSSQSVCEGSLNKIEYKALLPQYKEFSSESEYSKSRDNACLLNKRKDVSLDSNLNRSVEEVDPQVAIGIVRLTFRGAETVRAHPQNSRLPDCQAVSLCLQRVGVRARRLPSEWPALCTRASRTRSRAAQPTCTR